MRITALHGTVWCASWPWTPRRSSQALGPTQRPVTRSFDAVSSPRRSWQRPLARATFDREVVDVAAAPPVLVEQLVVEHLQTDVDLDAAQFWPTFVSSISGTAVSATTMITTR